MKTTWYRLLALLLALTLVAAACGGGDDDEGAAPDDPAPTDEGERCEETVPGTQVDYGVYAPTSSLDPPQVSGSLVGGTEIANIYDVLMTYDHDSGEYEPKLAESLEPNDDFTQWTLTLREGITFSDGTPLTAQLVSDNIDRYFESGVRNGSAGFMTPITERRVVDERTLEIDLELPWATFPFVFADEPGMVVNLNAIGDDAQAFGLQPPDAAGVGPYVVERNVPGEELVLKARQDYWDGPVCIETLRFVFIPGAQATYDAYRSGELEVGFLREAPVTAQAEADGEEHFWVQQQGGGMIQLNHAEGRPAADPLVREAIVLALDEEVINQRAYAGALPVGRSLILEGSDLYSDDIVTYPHDADRARQALEEAKAGGYDGSLNLLCANSAPAPETALASEALLEAVGFEVEVTTIPTSEQIGQIVQGNYDAACWGLDANESTAPTTFLRSLHSESQVNRQSYASPEMDAAIEGLLAAANAQERKEAAAEINRVFVEDHVSFNFGAIQEGIVWKPEVRGIDPTTSSIFLFDKAYIDD